MPEKTITTTDHDYGPVNKYIDEKARLRRTRSVWGYTKSIALFLFALGIFLVLAAYAYNIYKKPYEKVFNDNYIEKTNKEKKNLSNDINIKNNQIKKKEEEIQYNPENNKLKKELEKLKKEKAELKKKLEKSVYNKTAVVFERKKVGNYVVTTGFEWNTLDDLRFGKKHNKDWCYIQGEGMSYDFVDRIIIKIQI